MGLDGDPSPLNTDDMVDRRHIDNVVAGTVSATDEIERFILCATAPTDTAGRSILEQRIY